MARPHQWNGSDSHSVHTALTRPKEAPPTLLGVDSARESPAALSVTDLAVLAVLTDNQGRVVSRDTIRRVAGLDGLSERRIDSSIVVLRRHLGAEALVTVRRRGWMLTDAGAVEAARLGTP